MTEVIGVRFKKVGKVYFFDPAGLQVSVGDHVIVETARGIESGEVATANHEVSDELIVKPLKRVVRKANEHDLAVIEENSRLEKDAFRICEEKIAKHRLDMKLVAVEYAFDHSKILFYFSADGRIDFRELVKDLASVFRTRIELRQIGVRDEAKMIGGLGYCGRPLCCTTFLDDFQPVSINMAKEQGLSLNPSKISGTCGRLMCCLKYESEAYKELIRSSPKVDTEVDTPQGRGTVMDVSLLKGCCKVRLHNSPDSPVVFPCAECGFPGHEPVISSEPAAAEPVSESSAAGGAQYRTPKPRNEQSSRPWNTQNKNAPRPPRNDKGARPPREKRPQSEQTARPKEPAVPASSDIVGQTGGAPQKERSASSSHRRRHRGGRGGQRRSSESRQSENTQSGTSDSQQS